jgi:hypothetical protein
MARVVPSLVARAIELTYRGAAADLENGTRSFGSLQQDQAANIAMVLALLEQIPVELLPTDAKDLVVFHAACGAMRGALASWSGGGHPGHTARLSESAVFGGSPIVALLRILRSCPDEAASEQASGLEFIQDPDARADIRIDMSNAHRALGNGEFKAATVLAGAVVEALLLWAIKKKPDSELASALAAMTQRAKDAGTKPPDKRGPEFWHLPEFITVADALSILDQTSCKVLGLTGEFRNLIHPGRVLRTGDRCDQSTALTAVGAMERTVGLLASALPNER